MVGSEQQSKNSGLPCIVQDGEGGEEGPVWSVPKLPIPAPSTDQLVRLAQKFLSLGVATWPLASDCMVRLLYIYSLGTRSPLSPALEVSLWKENKLYRRVPSILSSE